MQTKYKTAIIGGTMSGLGAAFRMKDDCIVIERCALPAFEFAHAFKTGKNWEKPLRTAFGTSLKSELEKRNLLSDGRISIASLPPVIFNIIKKEKLNFLFWTEITEIARKGKYWEINIFNASGLNSMLAENILDTTSGGIFGNSASSVKSKKINALLHGSGEIPDPLGAELTDCRFSSEKVFGVPLDLNEGWPSARKKLFGVFASEHKRMKQWRIAASAFIFDFVSEKGPFRIADKWEHLPSTAYDNPLEGFEAGYNFEWEK